MSVFRLTEPFAFHRNTSERCHFNSKAGTFGLPERQRHEHFKFRPNTHAFCFSTAHIDAFSSAQFPLTDRKRPSKLMSLHVISQCCHAHHKHRCFNSFQPLSAQQPKGPAGKKRGKSEHILCRGVASARASINPLHTPCKWTTKVSH